MRITMKTRAEGLYGRKQLLYMLVSIGVLLAGLIFVLQTIGGPRPPAVVWIGQPAGLGGHITLMWDAVRLALGRCEPGGTFAHSLRFWERTPRSDTLPELFIAVEPALPAPLRETYDARLYDGNCLYAAGFPPTAECGLLRLLQPSRALKGETA